MLTHPETQFKEILESMGYTVKYFTDKGDDDPVKSIYMQVPISTYSLDFASLSDKVAVEIDGSYWHAKATAKLTAANLQRRLNDEERDLQLKQLGWFVFRVTADTLDHEKMTERLKFHIENLFMPELDL